MVRISGAGKPGRVAGETCQSQNTAPGPQTEVIAPNAAPTCFMYPNAKTPGPRFNTYLPRDKIAPPDPHKSRQNTCN